MHGFEWSKWMTGTSAERLGLLPAGQAHALQQADAKARFTKVVTDISRAFALCAAHDEAIRLRDDIAIFQAVRSALVKPSGERKTQADRDWSLPTPLAADEIFVLGDNPPISTDSRHWEPRLKTGSIAGRVVRF